MTQDGHAKEKIRPGFPLREGEKGTGNRVPAKPDKQIIIIIICGVKAACVLRYIPAQPVSQGVKPAQE